MGKFCRYSDDKKESREIIEANGQVLYLRTFLCVSTYLASLVIFKPEGPTYITDNSTNILRQ